MIYVKTFTSIFLLFILPMVIFSNSISLGNFKAIHQVKPESVETFSCENEKKAIHLILQIEELKDKDYFEKNGIKFLGFLGSKTYIISLNCSQLPILYLKSIKGLTNIKPEYKLTKTLYDFLKSEKDEIFIDVSIFFYKDISENEQLKVLNENKIDFIKENNWYNCKLNKETIIKLLNYESIFLIKEKAPDKKVENYRSLDTLNVEGDETGQNLYEVRQTYGLDGYGINIGIWDAGKVYEHSAFQSRVYWMESNTLLSNEHATHVSGTIIANPDTNHQDAKGFCPFAKLYAWNFHNDLDELMSFYGLDVSNHSYGNRIGWNWDKKENSCNTHCYYYDNTHLFGRYTMESVQWDDFLYNSPFEIAVFSAGNDGDDADCGTHLHPESGQCCSVPHPKDGDSNGYDQLSGYWQVLKNSIVVGAIDIATDDPITDPYDIYVASYSSWGPTDDGRLKPDFVARGGDEPFQTYGVLSTIPGNGYDLKIGTSMAAPAATGAIALLQQHIKNLYGNGTKLSAANIKGLLAHTATDISFIGPDFRSGWGLIDVRRAADFLLNVKNNDPRVYYGSYSFDDETQKVDIPLYISQTQNVKVTISWNDPPGPPDNDPSENDGYKSLINDLDIEFISPQGQILHKSWIPWTGDDNALTGINSVDNVEQAVLNITENGMWNVRVKPTNLSSSQNFYVFISCENGDCIPNCQDVGAFSLFSPVNTQIFYETYTINLSWGSAQNAWSYDVYFGTDPNPQFYQNTQNTQIAVNVSPVNTYYWKIVAKNQCNNSTFTSGPWSFSVLYNSGTITASASPNPVEINLPSTIYVTVKDNYGNPVPAGTTVTFSTAYPGIFSGNNCSSPYSPSSVLTDSNGQTWIRFTSDKVGIANILIESLNDSTGHVSINIINSNANLNVEISVAYYGGGQGYAQYEINAIVTNTNGNPVSGQLVYFWASKGSLNKDHDITGSTGRAYVVLTVYEEGEVAVTADANGNKAASTFFAIIDTSNIPKMFPYKILTFSSSGNIFGLNFSPDGSKLIAANENSRQIIMWDTSNYNPIWNKTTNNSGPAQVSISPNNTYVAFMANDVEFRYVNNGNYYCESSITGSTFGTFISNSTYIGATAEQLYKFSLCGSGTLLYTLPSGQGFEEYGHMDFNPNKNWISACTDEGYLFVWNTNGNLIKQILVSASANAYDSDFAITGNKIAAVGLGAAMIFNTSTWAGIGYPGIIVGNYKYSVKFIDNDKKLAVGGNYKIEIIDLSSGQTTVYADIDGTAIEMDWNPLTEDLAVGTSSGKVYIFKPLLPPDETPPNISISYPQNGEITFNPNLTTMGVVTDESEITSFTINGSYVPLDQNGSFAYNITLQPGENTIIYRAQDIIGNQSIENRIVNFIVDNNGPQISNVSSTPFESLPGSIISINCQAVDDLSDILYVKARIKDENGTILSELNMNNYNTTNYYCSYSTENLPFGIYYIDIEAKDNSLNITLLKNSSSFKLGCYDTLGDINNNNDITSQDASMILQYIVGIINFENYQICRADVNEIYGITAMDAYYILKCSVGSCTELPQNFYNSCQNHGNCL